MGIVRQQHFEAPLQRGAGGGGQAHFREQAAQGQALDTQFVQQGLQASLDETIVLGLEQHVLATTRRKIQLPAGCVRGVRGVGRAVVLQEDHRHAGLPRPRQQAGDARLQGEVTGDGVGPFHERALHVHQQQGLGPGDRFSGHATFQDAG